MIITKVTIHNLFNFDHAELDLTIPKKMVGSTIPYEYLEGRESFRYRRVCILSGTNASGKTSFGRVLNCLQFAVYGNILQAVQELQKFICNRNEPAECSIEFATPHNHKLHYLSLTLTPEREHPRILYARTYIPAKASSPKARRKLQDLLETAEVPKGSARVISSGPPGDAYAAIVGLLADVPRFGWQYYVNNTIETAANVWQADLSDAQLFSNVLRTFDTSIKEVVEMHDKEGVLTGFVIRFENQDTVLLDKSGKVTNVGRLSRGTREAVDIACVLSRILRDRQTSTCNTYFLDEAMAFSHSELEIAMLNLLIEKLGRNAQLFYTTHNYEVIAMNMPAHSFVFLRKRGAKASFVQPEATLKKNDRSLLNYVLNDVFYTLPDSTYLNELLYGD